MNEGLGRRWRIVRGNQTTSMMRHRRGLITLCYYISLLLHTHWLVNHCHQIVSGSHNRKVFLTSSRVKVSSEPYWKDYMAFCLPEHSKRTVFSVKTPRLISPGAILALGWNNNINLPATGPPAAAENEYTTLWMQKAAVVLLLSTTVSKIKHLIVMNAPSLNP